MFGLNTLKRVKKLLSLADAVGSLDLKQIKKSIDEIGKFKEKLKYLYFILATLLTLTIVNTVLIVIILFKK